MYKYFQSPLSFVDVLCSTLLKVFVSLSFMRLDVGVFNPFNLSNQFIQSGDHSDLSEADL